VKLLLELSMECESLARAEALSAASALDGSPVVLHEDTGIVVVETSADPKALASRLGLCHFVSEWLDSCLPQDLEARASTIDVPGPIRVRSTKVGEIALDLATVSRRVGAIVGESRGVDLHSPASDIRLVFSNRVHVGRVVAAIDRTSFEKRKNRFLPFIYPASLHPKFARALVNLTQVPNGQTLLDPFCGTGAIVAEAAMIGLNARGTDIAERMIEGAGRNLAHLGLEADLRKCDVGDIAHATKGVRGIATDPPYGRSTSTDGEEIPVLYRRAFAAFADVLSRKDRVAIVVPDPALLSGADDFKILDKHELRVHRSLTRHFCVLEKH
jgi:tRNA (guanine10-N2)-dimethyltransferase